MRLMATNDRVSRAVDCGFVATDQRTLKTQDSSSWACRDRCRECESRRRLETGEYDSENAPNNEKRMTRATSVEENRLDRRDTSKLPTVTTTTSDPLSRKNLSMVTSSSRHLVRQSWTSLGASTTSTTTTKKMAVIFALAVMFGGGVAANNNLPPKFVLPEGESEIVLRLREGPDSPAGTFTCLFPS